MAKKSNGERIAVCETEIINIKDLLRKVCTNDIPHIFEAIGKLETFCVETRQIFKSVEVNSETLKAMDTKLAAIKLEVMSIQNQERLGKKEKVSIALAVIASITSVVVAFIT